MVYHNFTSDIGGVDLGQELDIVASKAFGKHWKGIAKFAACGGSDSTKTYRDKLWLQIEFNF